jgi:transposase-like protein/IS1 family transposase
MIKKDTEVIEKMNAAKQFCPNLECKSRGEIGQGNIVIHCRERCRYKCKTCGKTFNYRVGTAIEGLRKPKELFETVISLLAYGCPIQAIVYTYKLDERTVADWQYRAGKHCEKVHKAKIEQGELDLKHVQADEIRVKAKGSIIWIGLAIMVATRLWIAGDVSKTRDSNLTDRLMQQVRNCCKPLSSLLICTDGFAAYPKSILRAFREKVKEKPEPGAPKKVVWPDLHIGTVIKCTVKRHLTGVKRVLTYGSEETAQRLLRIRNGGKVLNTSFIERLNGTFRERLASLTRKSRHASAKEQTYSTGVYLVGSVYNFCIPHHQLSKSTTAGGFGWPCTPAMASGLTYHVWSVSELLTYKVPPPPLPVHKKRGRPRTKLGSESSMPKKCVSRSPKEGSCSSTT